MNTWSESGSACAVPLCEVKIAFDQHIPDELRSVVSKFLDYVSACVIAIDATKRFVRSCSRLPCNRLLRFGFQPPCICECDFTSSSSATHHHFYFVISSLAVCCLNRRCLVAEPSLAIGERLPKQDSVVCCQCWRVLFRVVVLKKEVWERRSHTK